MLLEVCRLWKAWLTDGTNGVNARLAGVEKDAGDPVPTALATIAEPTTHQGVGRLELPREFAYPGLLILPPTEAQLEDGIATEIFRAADFPVAFVWITQEPNTAVGYREGSYTMRAVLRAINALMENANVASRTRNGIVIEAMHGVSVPRPIAPVAQSTVSMAIFAGFQVTETNP